MTAKTTTTGPAKLKPAHPRVRIGLLLMASLAVLGLAACGGGDDGAPTSPETSAADAGSDATEEAGFPILGAWSMVVRQKGMEPFAGKVVIRSLGQSDQNIVNYPAIGCVGRWEYEGTEGDVLRFLEVTNPEESTEARCDLVGTQTLTPRSDDRLDFEYVPENEEFTASGTMTRDG